MGNLEGHIAVVTGASRGIGRGVAIGLGEQGATVYVTGRSTGHRPRTIDTTAREVTEAGGKGIPVQTDHFDDDQIAAVFAKVKEDHGHLDILVNNVFKIPDPPAWEGGFWEHPVSIWDDQVGIGLRGHYVASWHAAPLLFESPKRPIIINITSPAGLVYLFNSSYSVGKAGLDRLTHDMAVELAPKNVTALALRPGPTKTEFIEDQAAQGIQVAMDDAETPIFIGRVAAAVISDPLHHEMTGRVHWSSELGMGYGVVDENGETPISARQRFENAPRANPYSDEPLQFAPNLAHGGQTKEESE
tara:strand:+ start:1241 stop:2146 length:906 start_codon:yes stop_codon:yes gene_type:complete